MLDGTIYKIGGQPPGGPPLDDYMYELDLDDFMPAWERVPWKPDHHGGTINGNELGGEVTVFYLLALPDGTILAVGRDPTPEIYDPITGGPWKPLRQMSGLAIDATIARGYHSSAGLLPDGRVVLAGGQDPINQDAAEASFEVFYPPYLYESGTNDRITSDEEQGHRPRFLNPPTVLGTGVPIEVATTPGLDAMSITKVSLIGLSSTTHSVNFGGQYRTLTLNGTTLTPPRSAEEAPPGYYMLFLVNDLGHPSIGQMVRVWGISQSSISHELISSDASQFTVKVKWLTNDVSDPLDRTVTFFSPSGVMFHYTASMCSPCNSFENGRLFEGTYVVPSPEAGVWTYLVSSGSNEPESRSQSYVTAATSFEVAHESVTGLGADAIPPNAEGSSQSVAWGDFDNDGDPDLFVANLDESWLFRNDACRLQPDESCFDSPSQDGAPVFSIVNVFLPEDYTAVNSGTWADYDNDGDLDLFLARVAGVPNVLLENEGKDPAIPGSWKFAKRPEFLNSKFDTHAAAWADYDGDGLVDVYVVHSLTSKLHRNNGDGTFTDVTSGDLMAASNCTAAAWADYDNDGDPDLYVVRSIGGSPIPRKNILFRNDGSGVFSDQTFDPGASILADEGDGQAAAWADYDNNGLLDLMLVNPDARKLFRNEGDGVFSLASLPPFDGGRGVAWGDYDADGYMDVMITRGNREGPNELLHNMNGMFVPVSDPAFLSIATSNGAAWADFNLDGDVDLYVANSDAENELIRSVQANHWLIVDPIGTDGDRSLIGVRTRAVAGGLTQVREISGGAGRGSQNGQRPVLGLGSAEVVDVLEVQWPTGEKRTEFQVNADQVVKMDKWMIEQTLSATATKFCIGGADYVRIDLDWQTNEIVPDLVTVEVSFPVAGCTGVDLVQQQVPSGTSHSFSFQDRCRPGPWYYTIKMFKDGGESLVACRVATGGGCPSCDRDDDDEFTDP